MRRWSMTLFSLSCPVLRVGVPTLGLSHSTPLPNLGASCQRSAKKKNIFGLRRLQGLQVLRRRDTTAKRDRLRQTPRRAD